MKEKHNNYEEYSYLDNNFDDYDINDEYDDSDLIEFAKYNNNYDNYDYTDYQSKDDFDDEDDNYSDNKLPIRKKVVIIILLLIILFLIIWLTPMIINKNKSKESNKDDKITTRVSEKAISNNIAKIKEASLKYFNENNIPTSINDTKKITVKKLIDTGILKIDNELEYDLENSYVELQKDDDDYILKVKLITNQNKEEEKQYTLNTNNCISTYLCENEYIDTPPIEENIGEEENTNDNNDETIIENSYLYEYSKIITSLSEWSDWSEKEEIDCNEKSITCETNDINCLEETTITQEQTLTNTMKNYNSNRNVFKTEKVERKNTCAKKAYLILNGTMYSTRGNFLNINKLTKKTKANYGNWIYNGENYYNTPPHDNIKTRYVYVGINTSCTNCINNPKYIYDKYTYNTSLTKVKSLTNKCKNIKSKLVPTYSITNQPIEINVTVQQPLNICYKTTRTRNLLDDEKITKWSTYDDRNLLDEGYEYTGNKEEVKEGEIIDEE